MLETNHFSGLKSLPNFSWGFWKPRRIFNEIWYSITAGLFSLHGECDWFSQACDFVMGFPETASQFCCSAGAPKVIGFFKVSNLSFFFENK